MSKSNKVGGKVVNRKVKSGGKSHGAKAGFTKHVKSSRSKG